MGDIADMMLEGILDEVTGEYIGDYNERRFGTKAPGFPLSYERKRRRKPDTRRETYLVTVTRPEGVSIREMKEYLRHAVDNWARGGNPESPLFGNAVRPIKVRKRNKEPQE